jgi:hypothetical protein
MISLANGVSELRNVRASDASAGAWGWGPTRE